MSALVKSKSIKRKCKLYEYSKGPTTFLKPDWDEIREHIESRPLVLQKRIPIHLANKRLSFNKVGGSLKTLKTAFTRGNTDTEVFAYVNKFRQVVNYSHGYPISSQVPIEVTSNCVIDLDHSWFDSIEKLVLYFEEHRILSPIYISQTGPNNFHLVYSFKIQMDKSYHVKDRLYREEKLAVACMVAGLNYEREILNKPLMMSKIKAFGIDPGYLGQHPGWDKYRVGGSLKVKNGEYYKCVGWKNDFYRYYFVADLKAWMIGEDPWDSVDYRPEENEELLTNTYYKDHLQAIKDMVAEVLPAKYVDRYASFLCNNLTFLKQGKLFMSQLRLSSEFGIPQTTVSRHLKELIKAGVVDTDHSYMKTRVPKKYIAGPKIKALQSIQSNISLYSEYEEGVTNTQMLSDIRILVANGLDDAQVLDFVSKKMKKRPKHKRRSMKDIRCALRLWRIKLVGKEYANHVRTSERLRISGLSTG